MKLLSRVAHFFEKYSLLIMLIIATLLLVCTVVGMIALMCQAPAWRVIAWLGLIGIIMVLVALAWGIYDEVRTLKRNR